MAWQQVWEWVRENRTQILSTMSAIYQWLRGDGTGNRPGVLIVGPAGVGKTTLAKILAGDFHFLFDLPGPYNESVAVERYSRDDASGLEIVVVPGQEQRRATTWAEHLEALAAGKYRGLIYVNSYGYHSHGIGPGVSYKIHPLYKNNKAEFFEAFLQKHRGEEIETLRKIIPKITPPKDGKFWMLSLVTKQDLWWGDLAEVESFYKQGDYAAEIETLIRRHGERLFRHELGLLSLIISNFETDVGESLKQNTAGYDHYRHAVSIQKFFEMLDGLRKWEEEGK